MRLWTVAISFGGGNLVALLISFAAGIIVARGLGPEARGIVGAIMGAGAIAATFGQLGLRPALALAISQPPPGVGTDEVKLAAIRLLWLAALIGLATAATIVLAGGLATTAPEGALLGIVQVPIDLTAALVSAYLIADARLGVLSGVRVVSPGFRLGGIVVLAATGRLTVGSVMAAGLVGALAAALVTLCAIGRRVYPSQAVAYRGGLARNLLRQGFVFAGAGGLLQVNQRLALLYLSRVGANVDAGYLATAQGVTDLVLQVPAAISTGVFVGLSRRAASFGVGDTLGLLARAVVGVSALFGLGVIALVGVVIPMIYGVAFQAAVTPARIMAIGAPTLALCHLLATVMGARGRPAVTLRAVGAGSLVQAGMLMLLVPQFGVTGAAIAVVAAWAVAAGALVTVAARDNGLGIGDFIVPRMSDARAIRAIRVD